MIRYACMLEELLTCAGYSVDLIHPPALLGTVPLLRGGIKKWASYVDKYLIAPLYLRWKTRHADVCHICDQGNSMYLTCTGKVPTVVTCHDMIAVLSARRRYQGIQVGITGRLQQWWIVRSLARARHVICVSRKTEADLRAITAGGTATIKVIYNPLNRRLGPVAQTEIDRVLNEVGVRPTTRYLFHVGGNQWYKNRLTVMQIFKHLREMAKFQSFHLIMAGKPWSRELRELRTTAGLKDCVVEVTDVHDHVLTALYSGAEALLFPSREEGFGWPIIEAQACGCPVITTNRPPMTEVGGEAAIYIDPGDPKQAASTIAENWARMETLREAGFRNVMRFERSVAVQRYCEVYSAIIRDQRI